MKNPVQVAEAQVAFDCWIQELEENHQPEHINECKNKFYQELGDTLKHNYQRCNIWVISSDLENIKMIGLKPNKKIKRGIRSIIV